MTKLDICDRFINFLMNEFYESLKEDIARYSKSLTKAVERDNQKDIDNALSWIKDSRELMNDLSDENMVVKDFVGLLAEKYGLKPK